MKTLTVLLTITATALWYTPSLARTITNSTDKKIVLRTSCGSSNNEPVQTVELNPGQQYSCAVTPLGIYLFDVQNDWWKWISSTAHNELNKRGLGNNIAYELTNPNDTNAEYKFIWHPGWNAPYLYKINGNTQSFVPIAENGINENR